MRHFNYDRENDILALHQGFSEDEKFKCNIDAGDLILDISTKERVRGIEIMNASEFLKEFLHDLNAITDAEFSVSMKPQSIVVGLTLKGKGQDILAKIVTLREPAISC